MKKLILNAPIYGLNGEVLVGQTGRMLGDVRGTQRPEQEPVRFASIAVRGIIQSRTQTDEETLKLVELAERLNVVSKNPEPVEIELTDDEYDVIRNIINREAVIVKARFLQMVEEVNS